MSDAQTLEPVQPTTSRWARFFDRKLLVATALLGVIAVVSFDRLNAAADTHFAPKQQIGPDVNTWALDSVHTIDVTLVTADSALLACADDRRFGEAHCEFTKAKVPAASLPGAPLDDNRRSIIQPYRTAIGNHLVFIAGLWNTPALALRSHQEPSEGRASKELRRFVASCRLKFVGPMHDVELRWNPTAAWYSEKFAPVAVAEWCEIPREAL
ncbi:MAG: hypothetical protein RJA70_1897 [Pseudomonadota bacterium]|jgi:hypothetical protein